MREPSSLPSLVVVKPTFLRLKLFYAAFVAIIFIASLFLALVMLDNGVSFLMLPKAPSDYLIGAAFIVVGVLAVAFSLVLLLPALNQFWLAVKLEHQGQIVEGMVVEKYLEKDKEGKHYGFIACVFNENYLLEQNVNTSQYEQLMEGDQIKIRCLPNNPAIARLEVAHT
jgi:hypothetical protein